MAEDSFETALTCLKNSGAKITQQRKTILKYLINSHTHPTARQIYNDLNQKDRSLSLATVYNTLEALIKAKLVINIDDKKSNEHHFDYFGTPHYHIICDRCGLIVDGHNFEFQDLLRKAAAESNFLVREAQIEVHGLCPNCQQAVYQK